MQRFLSRLFDLLMKSWSWILLILLTILIKWASWYPEWVENYYTYGAYPIITKEQRFLFGWIPFSIGDLFYGFLLLVVVFRTVRFFKLLFQKKLTRGYFVAAMQQAIFFFLFVYVFFNLLWGLNYNRKGISYQLGIEVKKYSLADLDTLVTGIQTKVNEYAALVTEAQRDSFAKKRDLFRESSLVYQDAAKQFPFLAYKPASVKPSLFSYAGNILGFQGYYNPFSGEAQVNTRVPKFILPYTTSHEIAHQLGYAKEEEANFVGYLAATTSTDTLFHYSTYLDLFVYANRQLSFVDSLSAKEFAKQLLPEVKADINEWREFLRKYKNPLEPVLRWAYGNFLRANQQPKGMSSYDEVIADLIAFYKKYGRI